ncbi:mucin-13b isoform 10-T10 [Spinachia spinachia]
MAKEIKPLFVLALVMACVGSTTAPKPATEAPITTPPGSTTAPKPSTEAPITTPPGSTTAPKPTTEAPITTPPGSTTAPKPGTEAPITTPPGSTTAPKPTTEAPITTPPGSTTAPKPTTEAPTTTPPGSTTAPKPGTEAPTTTPPGPCDENQCFDGSTCQPRHNRTFECLCLAGDSYDYVTKECQSGQVFPGKLNLPGLKYDSKMENKTSEEFQKVSISINKQITEIFKSDETFSSSKVLEISQAASGKSNVWSMSVAATVTATVEIIFKKGADIKESTIEEKIQLASNCEVCLLGGAEFNAEPLCNFDPCDKKTTKCQSGNGDFDCTCAEDYIRTPFSDRFCIACPSGSKAQDLKECVDCPFGRSGLNCKETWKLSLVIVSSVLGGLLLIALILLPVLVLKSKKISGKEKNGDMEPYTSQPPTKQSLFNSSLAQGQPAPYSGPANRVSGFANAGAPRIPRATTTNSWEKRANMEMNPTSSRQNLVPVGRNSRLYDDHNDMNPVAQARPQSNPYTQYPPRANPYTQGQGHSNPYYMQDNARRF